MPRIRARSSASALTEASLASSTSARAASGLESMTCPAASSVMPMATSRAWAPSCRSRSIRRISAAPVSRASVRVWVSCLHPQRQLGLPVRRQDGAGQQAVAAQQRRGRQHPGRGDREAQHDQRPRGVARKRGRRDLPGQLGPDELDQAGRDDRGGQRGQDADDQVRRRPQQVPPGGRVRRQPPEPSGVGERPGGRGARTARRWARRTSPRPAAWSGGPARGCPAARAARRTGQGRARCRARRGPAARAGPGDRRCPR